MDLIRLLAGLGLLTRADKPCTVTAVGNSDIDPRTGSGALKGTFAVVINLDNTTDSPEFVVMTGQFLGAMQVVVDTTVKPPKPLPLINLSDGTLTPNEVFGVPIKDLGMVCLDRTKSGRFCLDPENFGPASFTGVFRLPFTVDNTAGVTGRV